MKALILTGRLVQDQEFIYPYYRLQEAGWEVDVAVKDHVCTLPALGYFGTKIPSTMDVPIGMTYEKYDLLVLPGGVKCMEHMRLDDTVIATVQNFHHAGKVIASICSAAQLLISARIVAGNCIAGYYSMKDDIVNAGAIYRDKPAVVDDRIVTSPHYKHLGAWMKAVFEEIDRAEPGKVQRVSNIWKQ